MGEFGVEAIANAEQRRECIDEILRDLEALEVLLQEGRLDAKEMHCGVEQEMFLVTEAGLPAPVGPEVLENCNDPRLVSELARFNLEANLDPRLLSGDFLAHMEADLTEVLQCADDAARKVGARVLLIGSLPTLERRHLARQNMTPERRYAALDEALLSERGTSLRLQLRGWDRYEASHDSVMPEAANTSLQLHQQVKPEDFVDSYNWAQLISAPLLAAATNSPFFCGRKLWHETRVAIFESATDARSQGERARGLVPRVSLGSDWLSGNVIELFRQQVARYRPLLRLPEVEDPFAAMAAGKTPRLQALMLHNGTVWRWNRACYGAGANPHLRIENRVLPAGPTVLDEVANAAFFFGLMSELPQSGIDLRERLPFSQARRNLLQCAREGLDARLTWIDDSERRVDVDELILEQLVPLARRGLERLGVDEGTYQRTLGVISGRVESGRTPSIWQLRSAAALEADGFDAPTHLTRYLLRHQSDGVPLHEWEVASAVADDTNHLPIVRDIMVRDVFTVRSDDALSLVGSVMRWQHIRQVPVVDPSDEVVGLITAKGLLAHTVRSRRNDQPSKLAVEDVMDPPPPIVEPDASLAAAIDLMLSSRAGCMVVKTAGGGLEGIVTEHDFLRPLRQLLAKGD